MRSSKSRSRSKSNRSRSMGNIVNRVFESSGPEGKVRGTPQQIIEKYNQLARDANLANDRVAAENFQQHAEHYARLLGEAQREQEARRDQQERERPRDDRGQQRSQEGGQPEPPQHEQPQQRQKGDAVPQEDAAGAPAPDVIEVASEDSDSGLVETPEEKSASKKRGRSRKPSGDDESEPQAPAAE